MGVGVKKTLRSLVGIFCVAVARCLEAFAVAWAEVARLCGEVPAAETDGTKSSAGDFVPPGPPPGQSEMYPGAFADWWGEQAHLERTSPAMCDGDWPRVKQETLAYFGRPT